MMKGNGLSARKRGRGLYVTSLIDAPSALAATVADELSDDTLKLSMLLGHYFRQAPHSRPTSTPKGTESEPLSSTRRPTNCRARPTSMSLARDADAAAQGHAAAAGPMRPREVSIQRAFSRMNQQHRAVRRDRDHPAMRAVPCGQSDGLPIGLMLIGKQLGGEHHLIAPPNAFEQAGDWRHV